MTVDLAFDDRGAGPPLVVLHGLFGAKRNWSSIAKALAPHHRVLTVDLRNHGASPWDDRHDYPALAADVAAFIRSVAGPPADVIGHSMGGKAAMVLALVHPELVDRLVVVDIAPAPSRGVSADLVHALQAVPLAACTRRTDVADALAERIPDPATRAFLAQAVTTRPDGLAWSVNLDVIARHFDEIRGFPAQPPGREFPGPALFVAGGRSTYLEPRHWPDIERLFPNATLEVIPDAGHWVHADAPAAFVASVGRFLER